MLTRIEEGKALHGAKLCVLQAGTELVSRILNTRMMLMVLIPAIMLLLVGSGSAEPNSAVRSQTSPRSARLRRDTRAKDKSKARSQPSPSPPTLAELESIRLQRERLEFDKVKSKSDAERADKTIKVEESKVFWSALATAVPLAVGVIAIVAGFWNQNRQAKHQFELKAAEIIFSGTTPQAVLSRGKALKTIFGTNLSRDFLSDFKPENIGAYKEPSEAKLAFLDHVLKDPNKKAEIVQLWFRLFPGDYKWLVRFDPESFKDSDLPEIKALFAPIQKRESGATLVSHESAQSSQARHSDHNAELSGTTND